MKSKLWKIALDEAHGFLIDVLAPLVALVRWLRRRDKK